MKMPKMPKVSASGYFCEKWKAVIQSAPGWASGRPRDNRILCRPKLAIKAVVRRPLTKSEGDSKF